MQRTFLRRNDMLRFHYTIHLVWLRVYPKLKEREPVTLASLVSPAECPTKALAEACALYPEFIELVMFEKNEIGARLKKVIHREMPKDAALYVETHILPQVPEDGTAIPTKRVKLEDEWKTYPTFQLLELSPHLQRSSRYVRRKLDAPDRAWTLCAGYTDD